MPFIYTHLLLFAARTSLLIRNIPESVVRRAVSLGLFINTELAQNAIQQIPFFRLLLSNTPSPLLFFSFSFLFFPFPLCFQLQNKKFLFSPGSEDAAVGGTPPSPWAPPGFCLPGAAAVGNEMPSIPQHPFRRCKNPNPGFIPGWNDVTPAPCRINWSWWPLNPAQEGSSSGGKWPHQDLSVPAPAKGGWSFSRKEALQTCQKKKKKN